jgi:hypothetical protein
MVRPKSQLLVQERKETNENDKRVFGGSDGFAPGVRQRRHGPG